MTFWKRYNYGNRRQIRSRGGVEEGNVCEGALGDGDVCILTVMLGTIICIGQNTVKCILYKSEYYCVPLILESKHLGTKHFHYTVQSLVHEQKTHTAMFLLPINLVPDSGMRSLWSIL